VKPVECGRVIAILLLVASFSLPAVAQQDVLRDENPDQRIAPTDKGTSARLGSSTFQEEGSQGRLSREGDVEVLREAPGGLWAFFRRLLLPRELSLVYDLRALISAQQPPYPPGRLADLRRLDAIYMRAVYLAEGDPFLALFALSFATLPYHTFPARVPLFDIGVTIPVSTESHEDFSRRMKNLPGRLFPDSPPSLDRDKLPHFFGSAWLQCVSRNPDLVEMAGELLELAEEMFKLEGSRDERDIIVNRLGVDFAIALQQHRQVLPSDIFKNFR
jgi:hypothetical protein